MGSSGSLDNPLLSDSAAVWDELILAVDPASLLVVIDSRMGVALRRRMTAEDILQDALLCAWRDRKECEWRGIRSFRAWLLTIIDHRICDASEHESALKRGGGEKHVRLAPGPSGTSGSAGPIASTTPSRVAIYREQAAAMQAALAGLPDDVRDTVRLRLFEQLSMQEIAERLGIGISAARHRFYKGSELYQHRLMATLATRSDSSDPKSPPGAGFSAVDAEKTRG